MIRLKNWYRKRSDPGRLECATIQLEDVDEQAKAAKQRIADKENEVADAQKRFAQISTDQQAIADSVTEKQQNLVTMMATLTTLERAA